MRTSRWPARVAAAVVVVAVAALATEAAGAQQGQVPQVPTVYNGSATVARFFEIAKPILAGEVTLVTAEEISAKA